MSREARARLAAAQAELVRALIADGPVPQGFDEARMAMARQVLHDKQARIRRARAMQAAARDRAAGRGWYAALRRLLGYLTGHR